MTKAGPFLLAALFVASLGLYGCTHQKNGAFNTKIREMEERYTKLEEDYRAVAATGEANRKKLLQAEADKTELSKQIEELKIVVEERDEVRKQLATRTTERDGYQAQLMQFSRDLQALAGRIESAAGAPRNGPEVVIIPTSRQSQ